MVIERFGFCFRLVVKRFIGITVAKDLIRFL